MSNKISKPPRATQLTLLPNYSAVSDATRHLSYTIRDLTNALCIGARFQGGQEQTQRDAPATPDLAFGLFDREGCVQRDYIEHTVRKGSGARGRELDHGDLLFIKDFSVHDDWRGKGLATRHLAAVLDKARQKMDTCDPVVAVCAIDGTHASKAFWRSMSPRMT